MVAAPLGRGLDYPGSIPRRNWLCDLLLVRNKLNLGFHCHPELGIDFVRRSDRMRAKNTVSALPSLHSGHVLHTLSWNTEALLDLPLCIQQRGDD